MIGESLVTVETLTAFLVCALLAYPALQETCNSAGRLMQFRAVAERIERILALPVEDEGAQPLANKRIAGAVRFERLSFTYETGGFGLKDFNLDVKAGQMVAMIGPSGAGKSTILDFIPRFLAPQSGKVLIDGQDIATVRLSDLRRQIGVVPQEPILFEATIEENLRFGAPDASGEELLAAARAAHVHEFVQLMPDGYGSRVEARGRNLSVGQRQRIAIARVFLKNPRILLFDEPTSALDGTSERLVREAVRNATVNRTTLIVAHRMSTVRDADRILVIERGRIVEDGSHEDLCELRGLYHSLYSAQFEGATETSAPQAA
jgi:ABC-type multidrug transport system fused ATPase/permease subunit